MFTNQNGGRGGGGQDNNGRRAERQFTNTVVSSSVGVFFYFKIYLKDSTKVKTNKEKTD